MQDAITKLADSTCQLRKHLKSDVLDLALQHMFAPDACLRLVILGPPDADPELFDEELARLIFERQRDRKAAQRG